MNGIGGMSVYVSMASKPLTFVWKFWAERNGDMIFGMHTKLMKPFSNDTNISDPVTLTLTFISK